MAALFMSHGAIDGPQARQCQAAFSFNHSCFYSHQRLSIKR
jgi:hypothetical protein